MATFLMFGKYNAQSIKGISKKRTQKVSEVAKKLGGKVLTSYALLDVTICYLFWTCRIRPRPSKPQPSWKSNGDRVHDLPAPLRWKNSTRSLPKNPKEEKAVNRYILIAALLQKKKNRTTSYRSRGTP